MRYCTTNGQPYTIGSSSSTSAISSGNSNSNSGYTGTPDADGWVPSYEGESKWGKVSRTYTPSTPSASYKSSYTDVASDAWYYNAVMTLTDGGILGGVDAEGTFAPYGPVTRGQFCQALYNVGLTTSECINYSK